MLNELFILAKIREGDIKAFEEIFRRYYSPLCWYAAGITGDTASAEEIVEELFYVLWKNRERLQVFQSVKSYLYRSVRNEAVQFCEHQEVKERYRASVRTESGPGYSSDPHAHLEYEELRTLIRHTLDKQHRQPFRTREARHVLPVNPAGHHLEPGIQSGITEDRADGSSVNMALNRLRWVGCIFYT